MDILDHAHHSPFDTYLFPDCRFCNPPNAMVALENARKMQQLYPQKHDVQLEIDLDPEEETNASDDCFDEH